MKRTALFVALALAMNSGRTFAAQASDYSSILQPFADSDVYAVFFACANIVCVVGFVGWLCKEIGRFWDDDK